MAFPQAFMDELVHRNPIEEVVSQYVSLTKKGSNYFGLCPFHNEKTGSFSVAPNRGIYYCFGCHKGGGVINFMMEIESLDFPDAVRRLAKRANMEVPEDNHDRGTYKRQERLWALCKEAAVYFRENLYDASIGKAGQDYLIRRRLSQDTIKRFGLGFAPEGWDNLIRRLTEKGYQKSEILEAGLASQGKNGSIYDRFRNRVMFPIIDIRGNVIGFGGRVMDDSTPKYLNSPETIIFNKRKNLFAMNIAKKTKSEQIILTEGYMDAIALHQYGFDCAVASLGTSLTEEQATLLGKYTKKVVLIYDADAAGQNATQRAIPMLERAGVTVRVLKIPDAKDPDEFLKKFGADRFKVILEGAQNQMDYRLLSLCSKYDITLNEGKVGFLKDAAAEIAALYSPVEREVYGAKAAEMAGIAYDAFKMEVERARKQRQYREKKKEEQKNLNPIASLQPAVKGVYYDEKNVKSGRAQEQIIVMCLQEQWLFKQLRELTEEDFTVPFLKKAYLFLKQRYADGSTDSILTASEGFEKEELSYLSKLMMEFEMQGEVISEEVLHDCIAVLRNERTKKQAVAEIDLMKYRDMKKKREHLQ